MFSLLLYAMLLQPPVPKEAVPPPKPGKYDPPVQSEPVKPVTAPAAPCSDGTCGSATIAEGGVVTERGRVRFRERGRFFRGRRGGCGAGG